VLWIGGVAFVTLVVMPSIRSNHPAGDRLAAFGRIEGRFAPQARIWVLLAGVTGFWMVYRGKMWAMFADPHFWWMHAMVALWTIFMLMLMVAEPLFIHPRLTHAPDPEATFTRMQHMHPVLLVLSVVTVMGAVAGSHGLF
jgi:uncharacterized membrane protein